MLERTGEKPSIKVLFRLIKTMLKTFPGRYTLIIIFLIISTIASIINTVSVGTLINSILEPFTKNDISFQDAYQKLIILVCVMVGVYIIGVVSVFFYQRIIAITGQRFLEKFRVMMFDKMQDLPVKFFDTNKHGAIMSTYTNDADSLWQLSAQTLPQLLMNLLTIVILLGVMFASSIYMSIVVVIFSIIMIFTTKICGGTSSKAFLRQQVNFARLEGYVQEMLSGQKVVKVFNHEKESIEGFDEVNAVFFKYGTKGNTYTNILMPLLGNIGHLMYISVALTGGILITKGVVNLTIVGFESGSIAIGTVVMFLMIARQFTGSVINASSQFNSVVLGMAGATRMFALIDEPKEVDDGYVTLVNCHIDEDGTIHECQQRTGQWAWKHPHSADGSITYTKLEGDIVLKDVDFAYDGEHMVLHDINVYAHAGQKIAFVGATGAGKTTITNLINRFYDIADGKIRYDGININKIKKADLRNSLGLVLQDTNLFSGTIMDNIRYGNLNASDEECINAAKLANAHDFIERLPNGYQTILSSNGNNLSQGQRQLLSIARVAVANPPVLILDEATSSIDTRTEALVQQGMDALMKGRTVFVIAHRLSTIRNSDAIMVLDHGHIIERGNHEDLLKKKGTYYQLYTGSLELD